MTHWIFADQLGAAPRTGQVLLVESLHALRRRRYHRQKLHLVLSALRHRAAELGDRAVHLRTDTYAEALAEVGPVTVCEPTSFAAQSFVSGRDDVEVVKYEGYATHRDDFAAWAAGERGLRLEDFYRWSRRKHGVLMDGGEPAGGRWNYDSDNREPPPKGARTLDLPDPYRPREDEIDDEVRADLDRLVRDGKLETVGDDGPRWFPATRQQALRALDRFIELRLPAFGPQQDAVLKADPVMSHSLLSPALNLGLLHPLEVVRAAEDAYRSGAAPLGSVEGFVRQVLGWREYVWGVYWHLGPSHRERNVLRHHEEPPRWLKDLDPAGVDAACLSDAVRQLRDTGWTHHIPRLMVLGNWALQRGIDPASLAHWFHVSYVDGYDWVMGPNVIGMSQWADGGQFTTKPYTAGGAYIDRMSDHCGGCRYDPKKRLGEDACPFTAGYWAFLARHEPKFRTNHRMSRPLAGMKRLADLDQVIAQENDRGLDS